MAEFIIIFREVLEAGLIIGILYTYLNKVDQQSSIARMWQGVLAVSYTHLTLPTNREV